MQNSMEMVRVRFGKADDDGSVPYDELKDIIHFAKKFTLRIGDADYDNGTTYVDRDSFWDNHPTAKLGKDSIAMREQEVKNLIPTCQNGESPLFSVVIPIIFSDLLQWLKEEHDDHGHLARALES